MQPPSLGLPCRSVPQQCSFYHSWRRTVAMGDRETTRPPLLMDAETRPREGRDQVTEELGLCSARAQGRASRSVLGAL